MLLPGGREQLVVEHLFSREGWVAVFCEQNLFPSLLFVLVSLIPPQSVVAGVGEEQYVRDTPWPFTDAALWHMPGYQQSLDISGVCELFMLWDDNFYCRTDGKRKEMRQNAWQWKWLSTAAGRQRHGEISVVGDFKTQLVKTLNNMT